LRKLAGNALLACLIVLGMISMLSMSALRSATVESKLVGSLAAAQLAATLADAAIQRGLQFTRETPEQLPGPAPENTLTLPSLTDPGTGQFATIIRFLGKEDYCPNLSPAPAERLHYEITGIGLTRNARAEEVQGVAICREICPLNACTGTEQPLQLTYRATVFE
jgi:hypothetical protein